MLGFIPPMLPTLVEQPPEGDGWVHEIKFDGYRTQVVIEAKDARAFTRNGFDWTGKYGTILDAARALKCRSAIIDGEVAVQAQSGVTDFRALRRSITSSSPRQLILFAFDLLHLDGRDLRSEPLLDRRRRLEDLIGAMDPASRLHFSSHHVGDGPAMFQAADQAGLEGIVSKRADSRYISGRAKAWFKTKSFTVADYSVLGVERSDTGMPIALLATLGDKAYVGNAMVTLTAKELDTLWKAVERLGTPQGRLTGQTKREGATWLKSGMVARVRHLRGEDRLRLASLQTIDPADPLPDEVDVSRHGKGE